MPASTISLEPWLEQAVRSRAVTLDEAWQVQDLLLSHSEMFVQFPPALWPVAQRLHLFEARPYSNLVH